MLRGLVGATRALENIRFTFAVPPTVEHRYTAAEYALADALLKQNSLQSSPPTYLEIGSDDTGRRSSCSLRHLSCCEEFHPRLTLVATVPE